MRFGFLVLVVIAVGAVILLLTLDRRSESPPDSIATNATSAPKAVEKSAVRSASPAPEPVVVPPRKQPSPEGEELFQARGDQAKIEALLARGVDIDALNHVGWTALYAASIQDEVEPIRFLLDAGADPNAPNSDGTTALGVQDCIALPVAELLISRGAKVDVADDVTGFTPLHQCADHGDAAVVELLIAHGADVNTVRKDGSTPLHDAARWGRRAAVEALLRHGADPTARDQEQSTPLWIAIDRDALDVVEPLAQDPVLDLPNEKGTTPLMKALYGRHEAIARFLVERGADVRLRSKKGETALHVAASYSTVDTVQFLLDHGADVNAADEFGGSPLDRAEFSRHDDIATLLRERGAHVERFRCERQLDGGATSSIVQRGGCPAGATATPLPAQTSGS